MLLRFCVENYRSIWKEQELSMIAGPIADMPEVVRRRESIREGVLPVVAIYGANASGKTNVLRALQFMASAVKFSHMQWPASGPTRREPFAFSETAHETPSKFIVDIEVESQPFQYGFELGPQEVVREWLFAYPHGRKQTWFNRRQGAPISFSSNMPGEKNRIAALTRPNSLFLSAAAQNNQAALMPIFKWFSVLSSLAGFERMAMTHLTTQMCSSEQFKNALLQLLSAADFGITGVMLGEKDWPEDVERLVQAMQHIVAPDIQEPILPDKQTRVQFEHRVGPKTIELNFDDESDGTKAYFSMLGPILTTLGNGGVLCIDELDSSLHPILAKGLISLFNHPSSNPRGAQLVFNTHDTNLLDADVLRRDQVWFTEKDDQSATHLYPLSDFKPRRGENLQRGYLQGRYGAIPFPNHDVLAQVAKADNGGE
jgi:predicted ATPase